MLLNKIRTSTLSLICAALISTSTIGIMPSLASGQSASTTSNPVVPTLVHFSGILNGAEGKPLSSLTGVTFSLYAESQGGAPLWLETQNVQPTRTGQYTVTLGSTTSQGLPTNIFASGEARWLGVRVEGQEEQVRVMLLAVPYALKAGDAQTIGGLPPSAFMLAGPAVNGSSSAAGSGSTVSAAAVPTASSDVTTTGGVVNAIPLFTTATNIQKSILTQTGVSALNVAGKLNLPALGVATATAGKSSRPEDFVASAFNSTSAIAVPQTFQLQAAPAGNNTAAPFATLDLLYGSGTAAPTETGLKISEKGLITFASGQIFPGTGKGTITGVTAGTGLTGGGTTGAVTLNLNTANIPQLGAANDFTAPQEFKANAGVGVAPSTNGYTPLSVGGATSFGTWLSLANSSAGGHTWNIISAGSGNAEGAGNLGITDLTGKSTIWLEGNTNTANLTATGTVGAAALVVTSTAGAAIIDADGFGKNAGGPTPGLRFGGGSSGEGIASNRVIGLTKFGLDFYTNYTARMSILQTGQVAMGTASPGAQLGVVGSSNSFPGIYTQGGAAASGSGQNGSDGIDAYGNSGDGAGEGGTGGLFSGGGAGASGLTGEGIVVFGGTQECFLSCVALNYAGDFQGSIFVKNGSYQPSSVMYIDHPLDPANKYLSHSSVESSEMKNIYDGTITTDASGEAVVELPEWFESLNRDFRYQLTAIGQFAQAIVAEKIADHHFTIRTNVPNVEVSWQVTGVRQDAWANAHRTPVEQQKNARERGHYMHPELYGAPEESSIEWARHPQMMKRLKAMRQAQASTLQASQSKP
jgi:trimeric autotransporter adhesin